MVQLNAFALVILAALLLQYGLRLVAAQLNLGALDPQVPEPFRDLYDPERYRRSQEYTRVRTRFGLLLSSLRIVGLLVFWLAGGFALLDATVRRAGFGPLVTGVLFIGALGLAAVILGLPARYYSTFVIEERFGFNRTTRRTFWADTAKSLALAIVLGGPMLLAVLALFQWAGSLAWLYCWAAATAYMLIMQYVAPRWILPLFNKFEPLEEGELRDKILAYAAKVHFPLRGLFVMDGSRRSSKANAFFTGFGKNKRIALFDTLVRRYETDEIVAVLAHEIGHYKKRHIPKRMVAGIALSGVFFALLGFFLRQEGLYAAFGVSSLSLYAGLVFFGLLYTPLDTLLSIAMNAWSRKQEYEADRYALETTARGADLVSALRKLAARNLSNLTPHPFHVALHHSHPPVLRRIEVLRQ
jgi:STE24 endopeptidase